MLWVFLHFTISCDLFTAHITGHRSGWCCHSTSHKNPHSLFIIPHRPLSRPFLSLYFILFPFTPRCNFDHISSQEQGELSRHILGVKGVTASRRDNGAEANSAHHSFAVPLIPNILGCASILGCSNSIKMSLAEHYYHVLWFNLDTLSQQGIYCISHFFQYLPVRSNAVKAQCKHTGQTAKRDQHPSSFCWNTGNK